MDKNPCISIQCNKYDKENKNVVTLEEGDYLIAPL